MDIGKTKNNYDKEEKPKCFNCNKYRHIAKECQERKEKDSRKCFKCERKCHIAKDCKEKQPMKIRSIKEESDNEEKSFGEDFKQAQYKRSMYLIPKINILFLIKKIIIRKN